MKIFLFIVVLAVVVMFFVFANRRARKKPRQLDRTQVAAEIESFLNGGVGAYDWDDFLTFPIADPNLNAVRERCAQIEWTTETGRGKLREEIKALKHDAAR